MPQDPRMTLREVVEDMRRHGMNIAEPVVSNCLKTGAFPFGHQVAVGTTGRTTFLIMRKDYEDWAKEYLEPYANS